MDNIEIDPFVSASVDSTLKQAQKILFQGEKVAPQVILFARKNSISAIFPVMGIQELFRSKQAKSQIRPIVKKVWQTISGVDSTLKLTAVLLLSDAWVETVPMDDFEQIRRNHHASLADRPGMGEALVINLSLSDRDVTYQWPYVRGKGEVVFADTYQEIKTENREFTAANSLVFGMWPL